MEEAKLELREVVEFLRSPEKFTKLGGKLPSGKNAFEAKIKQSVVRLGHTDAIRHRNLSEILIAPFLK